MPTLMRKTSRLLQRVEPVALLFGYFSLGGMALFAFISPPQSSRVITYSDLIIEGVLLSIGAALCVYGHLWKREIAELIGLIFAVGGIYVLLFMCFKVLFVTGSTGILQIAFLVMFVLGLIWSRIAKLQDSVSRNWLKPPSAMINEIYK